MPYNSNKLKKDLFKCYIKPYSLTRHLTISVNNKKANF